QANCGTHAGGQAGAAAAGGGSGRQNLAAAAFRAQLPDCAQPRAASRSGHGGGSGIPRGATAARAATRGAIGGGAGGGRSRRDRRPGTARPLQSFPDKGAGVKITEQEVRYVAGLANLNLSDGEVARFQGDLNQILEHMDKL